MCHIYNNNDYKIGNESHRKNDGKNAKMTIRMNLNIVVTILRIMIIRFLNKNDD
jgi:hypothetical protein